MIYFFKLIFFIIVSFNQAYSDELVNLRFGSNEEKQRIVLDFSENISFDHKIFGARIRPGLARNEAYNLINSDYIMFHDADDEPHPKKLSIHKYIFEKTNCDHINHLFQPIELDFLDYKDITYLEVDNKEVMNHMKKGSVILNDYSKMPVAHGLISMKTEKLLEIKWNELKTGEDRDFITKSIKKNNKLVIVEAFLSKYDKLPLKSLMKYYPKYYKLFN